MQSFLSVIFFRIFRSTVYSTVALAFCAWIIQSSRYLSMLNINLSLAKFFRFTSLLSVDIISFILPISLSVSAAFVFHRLAESNQMIVLQSAGISLRKLLGPLMTLAVLCSGYVYISNAYLSPLAWKAFRNMEYNIKNNIEPPTHAGLIFSSDNFSVYSQQYLGNLFFERIFIVDTRDSTKAYTLFARLGSIEKNILSLADGERIETDFISHRSTSTTFKSYSYDLKNVMQTHLLKKNTNEYFIHELLISIPENLSKTLEKKALFHQKTLSPLLAVIFALFAFGFVALAPYARKITHKRIIALISLIITVQGVFLSFSNMAITNPTFSVFNYIVVILLLIVALIVTKVHHHE